jgi:hypothetical protein
MSPQNGPSIKSLVRAASPWFKSEGAAIDQIPKRALANCTHPCGDQLSVAAGNVHPHADKW